MSKEIDGLVEARRKALGRANDKSGKQGLALSGGGIRSATFCFGLLAALSRNRLLERFDLLSTVSGGGYIGGMLGRLLSRATSADQVRAVLAAVGDRKSHWFQWWLRANGRYLIPRGAADRLFAATIYLRNLVAIHLELGVVGLLLGVVLVAADVGVWKALADGLSACAPGGGGLLALCDGSEAEAGAAFNTLRGLSPWLPTPWVLLVPLVLPAAFFAAAYWVVQWVARGRTGVLLVQWLVLVAGAGLLGHFGAALFAPGVGGHWARGFLMVLTVLLVAAWLLAIPGSWLLLRRARLQGVEAVREERVRRSLTDGLVWLGKLGGLIVLLGLVDRAAWFIAFEYRDILNAGLWLALVAAIVRALLPAASALNPAAGGTQGLLMLGQAGGYLLMFSLSAWWVSIVHRAASSMLFGQDEIVAFGAAEWVLVALAVGAGGYLLATGRNFAFLNLSSLHTFYRARLVRSYLGAANPARFGKQPGLGATDEVTAGGLPSSVASSKVFNPDPGDDLAMTDYRPQQNGGPVHLINVCLNQTRDPRGGLFNQDRRGQMLTVASGGAVRVGLGPWQPAQTEAGETPLTLGSWIAISGAAVAPGLGQMTRGGLAALVTFAGLRLGYWWRNPACVGVTPRWWTAAKTRGLLSEVFANFGGAEGRDWFLSDGGHFENTAAYALLAEQASFIVIADCGADPEYRFGDLENLVRTARIDLEAEIAFWKPKSSLPDDCHTDALAAFGSLDDLAAKDSNACLALACVTYRDGSTGLIVVVKPNLCASLPVDLRCFARQTPDFPQQSTADQFFDEAQWESYYQLGQHLGAALTPDFVSWLQGNLASCFEKDMGRVVASGGEPAETAPAEPAARKPAPLPERLRAGAVTATIGLGGVLSVAVPAWTEVQKVLGEEAARRKTEAAVLGEIREAWMKLPPPNGCDPAGLAVKTVDQISGLADVVMRNSEALCADQRGDGAHWSQFALQILLDAQRQCTLLPITSQPGSCVKLLEALLVAQTTGGSDDCLFRLARTAVGGGEPLRPRYWAYAYTLTLTPTDPRVIQAHPADPVAISLRKLRDESLQAALEARSTCVVAQSAPAPAPAPAPAVKPSVAVPPVSSTAPSPAPSPAPAPVPATKQAPICAGRTIYIQIYGPTMRDKVRDYREPWRQLGASVPPIEDVVATATSKGRPAPTPVAKPSVRYHDEGSKGCAEALVGAVGAKSPPWTVNPLAPNLRPTPGVIEVWVPTGPN